MDNPRYFTSSCTRLCTKDHSQNNDNFSDGYKNGLDKLYLNPFDNAFQVGEFNEFLQEHEVLEQFLRILGVEIEEEKIFVHFTVYRRILVLLALRYCLIGVIKFTYKVFKSNDCCV